MREPRLPDCTPDVSDSLVGEPADSPVSYTCGSSRASGRPRFHAMDYAIIKLGNKQHRVRDGETLVVDRLPTDEGKTFEPVVLLGETKVTATVLAHGRGPKILIGKYRKRTGYKRHNGFRAAVSRSRSRSAPGARRERPRPQRREAAKAEPVEEPVVETATVEAPTAAEGRGASAEAAAPATEAGGTAIGCRPATRR